MKQFYLVIILVFIVVGSELYGQASYKINGVVKDTVNKTNVPFLTLKVKNSNTVTLSNKDGNFSFETIKKPPFIISGSSTGYAGREILISDTTKELEINLSEQILMMDQVIVSASRIKESFLRSPVSIEVLNQSSIRQTAAPSFFDALENLKGVQMTT